MSTITVVLIRDGRLSLMEVPFRQVIAWLSDPLSLMSEYEPDSDSRVLDAGYMVIDADNKIVLDGQGAFSWHHLPKKARTMMGGWVKAV